MSGTPSTSTSSDPLIRILLRVVAALPEQMLGFPRATFGLVVLWSVAVSFALAAILGALLFGFGSDSHAYYSAWNGELYDELPGELDAYLYSPAFAQVIWPLTLIPWPVFATTVGVAAALALVWLLQPVATRYRVPLLVMCLPEVVTGNIFWLLALVTVLGFRRPVLWVIPAVTKILPTLGVVWFLARGEWRKVFVASGTIVCVCAVSYAIEPHLWFEWIRLLFSSSAEDDLSRQSDCATVVDPRSSRSHPRVLCGTSEPPLLASSRHADGDPDDRARFFRVAGRNPTTPSRRTRGRSRAHFNQVAGRRLAHLSPRPILRRASVGSLAWGQVRPSRSRDT